MRAIAPHLAGASRVLDVGCGLTDLPGRLPGYAGCDRDPVVLDENRRRFPQARFVVWDIAAEDAPGELDGARFDVVLMAAILEHLPDAALALRRAAPFLSERGRIVATTPHPWARLPLETGARLGLLSHAADEEHEALLGREALMRVGASAGLACVSYRRFLAGLNQLVVYARS
jgi:SAM-dependent methyltransferase